MYKRQIFLLLGAFCKKEETDRMIYKAAVINFLFLIGIALFYACCALFRKRLQKVSKKGVAEDTISSRWLT